MLSNTLFSKSNFRAVAHWMNSIGKCHTNHKLRPVNIRSHYFCAKDLSSQSKSLHSSKSFSCPLLDCKSFTVKALMFSTTSMHFSGMNYSGDGGGNKMLHDSKDSTEMQELQKLLSKEFLVDDMGHQVLVVQPYIKWGPDKKTNTTPDLMLSEAVALVKSLSSWKVIDKIKIGLKTWSKESVFGSGSISSLATIVASNPRISAVFISIDKLSNDQYYFLTNVFQVPVFDRYSLVIRIFKEHAKSPEAKMQVAMAELPYILGRHVSPRYDGTKKILMRHQKRISDSLYKLRKHRELTRKKRQLLEYPVIAVVGYTNAGKTSLIKALTEKESLTPQNVLFATLDVTMHEGFLPCSMKVLFADTIGFIADLPVELIEPFKATLEDAMLANVILHVMDVSHPDHAAQYDEVVNMLDKLNLNENLKENIITVGNKVDLISHEQTLELPNNLLLVSAERNIGLNQLLSQIERQVLETTNRRKLTVRVKSYGKEEVWLRKEATIISTEIDPKDSMYSLLKIIITRSKLDIFVDRFINSAR